MGTVPTFADGTVVHQADLSFFINPPMAACRQDAAATQTISNNTWTSVTMTIEDIDTDSIHTNSASSRFTIQTPGTYQVSGVTCWPSNATGGRGARVALNGSAVSGLSVIVSAFSGNSNAVPLPASIVPSLVVGDYLELQCYQSSGGNLSTNVSVDLCCSCSIRWVGA